MKTSNIYDPKLATLPHEIQTKDEIRVMMPLGLSEENIKKSLVVLEQTLVDSYMLYSMYKKHHWQLLGPTFYQLHLLFDKHAEEQSTLIDTLAERMQLLGGEAVAMPQDIAERTKINKLPKGAETIPAMITRLLDAHKVVIRDTREGIEITEESKDYSTNDLFVSQVLRTNELQVWFIATHLVDINLVDDTKNIK